MSLFRIHREEEVPPELFSVRIVRKFIIYRTIGNETRILGWERIVQRFERWPDYVEGIGRCFVRGWRDVRWAE